MGREELNKILGQKPCDVNINFKEYYVYGFTDLFGRLDVKSKTIIHNSRNHWQNPITEYKAINLEEGINDLEKYYLTFDLGSRLDGVLLNNFYIEISGFSVEDCLVHLIQIHSLKFKECYVSSNKPVALRLIEIIDNCYFQYINARKVESLKNGLSKKNIINITKLW